MTKLTGRIDNLCNVPTIKPIATQSQSSIGDEIWHTYLINNFTKHLNNIFDKIIMQTFFFLAFLFLYSSVYS